MTLSKDVYLEFEAIVGENNISDDPALLDSYRYPLSHTAIHLGPYYRTYTPRGAAVLLPGIFLNSMMKNGSQHSSRYF